MAENRSLRVAKFCGHDLHLGLYTHLGVFACVKFPHSFPMFDLSSLGYGFGYGFLI